MSSRSDAHEAASTDAQLVEQDDEPPSHQRLDTSSTPAAERCRIQKTTTPLTPTPSEIEQSVVGYGADNRTKERHSQRVLAFRKRHFPGISSIQWNDWHWQMANRIRSYEQLQQFVRLSPEEQAAFATGTRLPFAITPYYLALIDVHDSMQGLRRTVIPTSHEHSHHPGESSDPLAEGACEVSPGLIHRYPDRVLFLAVGECGTYCRYCTRSRAVGSHGIKAQISRWQLALDYIRNHTEIRDVLVSGGDPLTLNDHQLDWLLCELRKIPHIEIVRIGTKAPIVMPQRITPGLVRMLKKHHPLWMSLHFVHPDECTPEVRRACARLADAGIPLGSQTVLLKGINDDQQILRALMHRLLALRVRPYYLYQCDPILGSSHFRTSVAEGVELIASLRGHTSGYAVPTYVIDAPGGGGKIPLQQDYLMGHDGHDVVLNNFEGRVFRYPDCAAATGESSDCEPGKGANRLRLRTVA